MDNENINSHIRERGNIFKRNKNFSAKRAYNIHQLMKLGGNFPVGQVIP